MTQRICFSFLFLLSFVSHTIAQDRAPHGLAYQNPMAFSPTTYDFFHPNSRQDPCTSSKCSPLPIAAQVHATQAEATDTTTPETHSNIKAASIIGLGFAALLIVCFAMCIYYVAKTRQENVDRSKCVQPDV